jgi:chromosome segregation ATPase
MEEPGMRERRRAWIAAFCVVAFSSCNAEKRRLTEHLGALEEQHAAVSRRLLRKKQAMTEAEDRLRAVKVDLAVHNTEAQTYIQQHQIAAGCIRAARIQFDEDNAFSGEVTRCTRIGAALCSLALLNKTFSREVQQVAKRVGQADERAKQLQQQLVMLEAATAAQRAELDAERDAADDLAAQMNEVRNQLAMN